jgi:hypothetical protein
VGELKMENIYSMDWTFNIIQHNVIRSENHVLDDDSEYYPENETQYASDQKCGE